MKKRFLFPTILAIGSSAILPLVSCKKAEKEIQMITISGEQEVIKGKKATYSADVTTSSEEIDKTVTWSIIMDSSNTGSTIDATTGQFTAGNIAGKVTIRATSVVDETMHNEFDVNVVSAIKSITIGDIGDLEWDSEFTCKATVESPSGYDQRVTWEIEDENIVATINPETGKITTGEKSESFLIKATSVFDSTVYSTKRVNVVSPVKSMIISGDSQNYFGDEKLYTAEVTTAPGWTNAVEWYIADDRSGTGSTIDKETGEFKTGKKAGTVVIKAVSVADHLAYVNYIIKIESPIYWVTVNDVADMEWNGTYPCSANVARIGGYSDEVKWSIDEASASATINEITGELTAGTKTETITIRATSALDETISGTTQVKIISPIKSVSINKQTQALPTNGEADYSATVVASPTWSTDVTWEIAEGEETGSSINDSGHFVAGNNEGKVVIKAISTVDSTKFDTLDIYVQNTCPISGVETESDNAIVFGQSTVVKPICIPSIDGIYVPCEIDSCNVGDTGSTWTQPTSTLVAGNTAGEVKIVCKPLGYNSTYEATIYVTKNVFTSSLGSITNIANAKFTRVSVLPTITNDLGTYSVVEIASGAFLNNKSIKMVNLEKATNLSSIRQNAFDSSGITSLYIPKSVGSIFGYAFKDCAALTSVVIEDGSQWAIGGGWSTYLFSGCSNLKTINLEKALLLSCIDIAMFQGCGELTSITIPAGVTTIRDNAFAQCKKLTTINFNGTVSEWKAIDRQGDNWHKNVPTTIVHCIDDDCELEDR